jgi:hypothetical protein
VTRRAIATLATALVVAISGGTGFAQGAAGKTTLKTRIEVDGSMLNAAGQYEIYGKVLSKSPACRFKRSVSLHVVHRDGSFGVADTKTTKSGVGLFTLRSALAPGEGYFISAASRNLTLKSGKRLHCATGRTTPVYP